MRLNCVFSPGQFSDPPSIASAAVVSRDSASELLLADRVTSYYVNYCSSINNHFVFRPHRRHCKQQR